MTEQNKNCLNCIFVRSHNFKTWNAIYCGHEMHPDMRIGFGRYIAKDGSEGKNCVVYEGETK